jgi:hypothetical protein
VAGEPAFLSLLYELRERAKHVKHQDALRRRRVYCLLKTLTRVAGWMRRRFIYEKMLSYANRLALCVEQTGHSGEVLANFPQTFTHGTWTKRMFWGERLSVNVP